jgi:hypothetical protein
MIGPTTLVFDGVPVPAGGGGPAEIRFEGVDHSGPSYEARVFLNNGKADANTPQTAEYGYAGSFFVYGHGTRLDPAQVDETFRHRLPRELSATDAVARARREGPLTVVTVVTLPVNAAAGWTADSLAGIRSVRIEER